MQTKEFNVDLYKNPGLNKEQFEEVMIASIIKHVKDFRNMFNIWPYLENSNKIKLDDINPAEAEKKLLESIGLKSVDYDYLKQKYESYSYDDLKKEFDRIKKIANENEFVIKNQARNNLIRIEKSPDSELNLDEIFTKYDGERTSIEHTDEIDYSNLSFEDMLNKANQIEDLNPTKAEGPQKDDSLGL